MIKKITLEHVEFTLNKPIDYFQESVNKVCVANQNPFTNYQIGDYLGIDTDTLSYASSLEFQIWNNTQSVSKIIYQPTNWYNKEVVEDPNFQHGWVREWND
ncbi:MAG: hypothetical protein mread185_000439 [Mycoplasmataceae bacterium]|nr:MAG: hypothetical protein mread185_000439 [Mycoplasmataceae bacterium]